LHTIPVMNREHQLRAMQGLIEHHRRRQWQHVHVVLRKLMAMILWR
jgi:hypothetical protein